MCQMWPCVNFFWRFCFSILFFHLFCLCVCHFSSGLIYLSIHYVGIYVWMHAESGKGCAREANPPRLTWSNQIDSWTFLLVRPSIEEEFIYPLPYLLYIPLHPQIVSISYLIALVCFCLAGQFFFFCFFFPFFAMSSSLIIIPPHQLHSFYLLLRNHLATWHWPYLLASFLPSFLRSLCAELRLNYYYYLVSD